MTTRHTLSDLIDMAATAWRSQGYAQTTRSNRDLHLRAFMAVVGNLQIRSVERRHVDLYFDRRQTDGLQASSLNAHMDSLRAFFEWCIHNRYITSDRNPMVKYRRFRVMPKARLRVPASDFPRLLDCASHPRDRMVVALGLYLFLRQSEIASLKVEDVDLSSGSVHVTVHKTGQMDDMPISRELDDELRRWMTFYSARVDLQPGHYLCPAKDATTSSPDPTTGRFMASAAAASTAILKPDKRFGMVHQAAQRALEAAGYPIRDEGGRSKHEGIHTLRRSGARALYDHRMQEGLHDGVIREVQAMLHHASVTMTERYLGIEMDRATRDKRLRGQFMFGQPADNVVQLVREG